MLAGDYRSMYIPHGRFYLELTDADLTNVGSGRDFAFLMATGKKGLVITGPGELHITCTGSTKRTLLCVLKDCDDCHIYGFRLTGDLIKQDAVPNSETGVAMGFMFYNCTNSGISNSTLRKLIIPAWFTGQPVSPATVPDVSKACYLTDNNLIDYEQCSTFGAGTHGLRVRGNIMVNPYAAFKVSQNPAASASGAAGLLDFSGNTIYWTPDAKFAAVFFAPTTSEVAAGLVIECAYTGIQAIGNNISLEGLTIPSLPPHGNAGAIVMFESPNEGVSGELSTRRVTIQGGTLVAKSGYSTRFAIDATSKISGLSIIGVNHVGGFRVQTGSVPALNYGNLVIKGNIGSGVPGTTLATTIGRGRWDSVSVEQNTLNGIAGQETSGNESVILLTGFVCDRLIANGNTLSKGSISDFGSGPVTCNTLEATGNILRGFDLSVIGTTRATLDNECLTSGTATRLVLDAATVTAGTCRVSVGGSCAAPGGGNSSTALNLNGGLLRLNALEMFANSGSAFTLAAAVVIQGGNLYGSGAPTFSAAMGVSYADFSAGADGVYDKTTSSGTSGWKKRMFV